MPLIIINVIILIIAIIFFYLAYKIKVNKNIQQENYLQDLQNTTNNLENKIKNLLLQQQQIFLKKQQLQKKIEQELILRKDKREAELQHYIALKTDAANSTIQNAQQSAKKEVNNILNNIQQYKTEAKEQKEQINNEIKKIQASLNAGIEARLREQEKKDKIGFYKLSIDDNDLSDVQMLENLKVSFHKPVVLSKLIWSQYFQKQMTELCDRIFGKKPICGIYKITNLITEQCYIGQSVNVQQRMKQHCKCGLGIDASATNKLYNAMQKYKVWNFTFELVEQCSKELLNEKEKFWIEMYQSDKFGLNTMKGITK